MKTVSFKTVGCRLNQAETAQMASQFEEAGYRTVDFGTPCDVCVIHTCAITGTAETKCVRYAQAAKRANPHAVIVLAGCAVELSGDPLRQRTGADLAVGQSLKYHLPSLIQEHRRTHAFLRPPPSESPHANTPVPTPGRPPRFARTRAIVKVQDGCDFRCAYCVVPAVRGAPRSRPVDILDEVRQLTEAGHREIVLTGANLGTYRDDARGLVDLIAAVEDIPDVARVRLSSIEMSTVERRVVDHMAQSSKLCRYLHLPLQSGDDGILARMGRHYTTAGFQALVEYAMGKMPRLGLGTDIVAGFPGEDAGAFENTLAFIERLPLSNLHVFPFSRRPGTPAASMPDQVPADERKRRCRLIAELGHQKRGAFARSFIGSEVSVLIESCDRAGAGSGWTSEYVEARVQGPGVARNKIIAFTPTQCEDDVLS